MVQRVRDARSGASGVSTGEGCKDARGKRVQGMQRHKGVRGERVGARSVRVGGKVQGVQGQV